VGLGIRGKNPHEKKCWIYYPEENCPFYRCTVFSLYSTEAHVPGNNVELPTIRKAGLSTWSKVDEQRFGPYWSLMFEVSESVDFKPLEMSKEQLIDSVIEGAINTKLIERGASIVSVYYRKLDRGYPTPELGRDSVLKEALPLLKAKDIWSRGRFGAWKYEVGNQDHSVMQGVEAVDNILDGDAEPTIDNPEIVNGRKNTEKQFYIRN
jgi:hypothetical protein